MRVSVIGLGYVGSVGAAGIATAGHEVTGVDLDRGKIDSYRSGVVPFYEPGLGDLIAEARRQDKLRFLHTSEVSGSLGEIILLAMGTPTSQTGAADLRQVHEALGWIKEMQPQASVIVMKSTVPPGTGERLLETLLADTGLQYVANPEFFREGQAVFDWFNPHRIVLGSTSGYAIEMAKQLYRGLDAPYVVTDTTSAEMIKYAANFFLATKISFINDIAGLCDRLNASVDDVTEGISLDPRIGPGFLQAGVGYGGSCFPKDVRALDHVSLTNGHSFELLQSVIRVNNRQRLLPLHALRQQFGSLYGVAVGVLGLAFKPQTDDVREAPSLDLIRLLTEEGALISAYDPRAVHAAAQVLPDAVNLTEDLLTATEGTQALVLLTEWPEIVDAEWGEIAKSMRAPQFLFDGRNALVPAQMAGLGFQYHGVGRGTHQPLETRIDSKILAVA